MGIHLVAKADHPDGPDAIAAAKEKAALVKGAAEEFAELVAEAESSLKWKAGIALARQGKGAVGSLLTVRGVLGVRTGGGGGAVLDILGGWVSKQPPPFRGEGGGAFLGVWVLMGSRQECIRVGAGGLVRVSFFTPCLPTHGVQSSMKAIEGGWP